MQINGVKMIPSGLVNCLIDGREVRIIEMSNEAFVIRTAKEIKIQNIQVNFFIFKESRYQEVAIKEYTLLETKEEEFYIAITIATRDKEYYQNANALFRDYLEYIQLKLSGDDGYCSEVKIGYQEQLDDEFSFDFKEQKREWFEDIHVEGDFERNHKFELAISVENHARYQQYLTMGMKRYQEMLWKENHLKNHPLAKKKVDRVYIGNQFCHHLFPTKEQLFDMLEQAIKEEINITIVTTYLRESQVEPNTKRINWLHEWCVKHNTQVEIVVNDWGMIKLLEGKTDYLIPILGVLLNKRRKDPRYEYKCGYEKFVDQLAENSLNIAEYRKFLKESFQIKRYEYESCGYRILVPEGNHSLHFPYYQTNTSQYCTLYAKCTSDDRGNQKEIQNCPRYCEENTFLYPKHLKMVGRYNSLFGMDDRLLKETDELTYYINSGIDRVVITLL